jgi:hypothetical protein
MIIYIVSEPRSLPPSFPNRFHPLLNFSLFLILLCVVLASSVATRIVRWHILSRKY